MSKSFIRFIFCPFCFLFYCNRKQGKNQEIFGQYLFFASGDKIVAAISRTVRRISHCEAVNLAHKILIIRKADTASVLFSLFSLIWRRQFKRKVKREKRREQKETTILLRALSFLFGGDEEIRTLARLAAPTGFRIRTLQPLGYISINFLHYNRCTRKNQGEISLSPAAKPVFQLPQAVQQEKPNRIFPLHRSGEGIGKARTGGLSVEFRRRGRKA